MHDCSVATGDAWLRRFLQQLLRLPQSVIFVVFDEGSSSAGGGGHVAALATGTAVRPHSRSSAHLSHYSLLRTIEDAWGLPRLGSSASASPIVGIWRGN
jgi:acid phosphatase